MLGNINLTDIMSASEKIKEFIPQIKKVLPQLANAIETHKAKVKIKEGEFILYSVMMGKQNQIFIYAFRMGVIKNEIKTPEITIPKNTILIKEELFSHEITKYLDVIEQQGLMGLMNVLPIDSLTGFKF